MPNISVEKIVSKNENPLPIFEEIDKLAEEVRRRAFSVFERRGRETGHELDDWVMAEHEVLGWTAAELLDANKHFELKVTLPGYEPAEVSVTATPAEIVIHANHRSQKKSEVGDVLWTEFGANEVYRRFEMPEQIDVKKISATLENGILQLTVPKEHVNSKKQIPN